MTIYEPLTRFLMSRSDAVWEADFSEIEKVLGRKLPDSAYDHRTWWGNRKAGNHGHANAWREAGWQTKDVDIARRTVRFERLRHDQVGSVASSRRAAIDTLLKKATAVTGVDDHDVLIEEALNALIARDLAKYIASLGGSMPDAEAAPRRRVTW